MIKNPFHKEPEAPPPDPTIALQSQIEDLQHKQHILHAKIVSERNLIEKRKLIFQEADLLQKIDKLKRQKMPHEETKASQAIYALFKDPKRTYILELNGKRVKPDKNLMLTLNFYPCKHHKILHIKEILTYQHDIGAGTEQVLLAKWQAIFSANTTLTGSFNCQECRKAKQKKRREQHRYSDADRIGTCSFMLKVI